MKFKTQIIKFFRKAFKERNSVEFWVAVLTIVGILWSAGSWVLGEAYQWWNRPQMIIGVIPQDQLADKTVNINDLGTRDLDVEFRFNKKLFAVNEFNPTIFLKNPISYFDPVKRALLAAEAGKEINVDSGNGKIDLFILVSNEGNSS